MANERTSFPVVRSHTRTSPSRPPVARAFPPSVKATPRTPTRCHIRGVPSLATARGGGGSPKRSVRGGAGFVGIFSSPGGRGSPTGGGRQERAPQAARSRKQRYTDVPPPDQSKCVRPPAA